MIGKDSEAGKFMRETMDAFAQINLYERDPATRRDQLRETMRPWTEYLYNEALVLSFPASVGYTFWQPYVKGYHGESYLGYYAPYKYIPFIWMDVDEKYEMTGRR